MEGRSRIGKIGLIRGVNMNEEQEEEEEEEEEKNENEDEEHKEISEARLA